MKKLDGSIHISHLTNPVKDTGQVIGYSHPTKQPKNGCKVVGYGRPVMYRLHPQALKVRNLLEAQAHAELSGVDRGYTKGRQPTTQQAACGIDTKANKSATTTHRRPLVAALCHFQYWKVGLSMNLFLNDDQCVEKLMVRRV